MNLKGKYALITGASRGIGRAIALKLASEGVHVAINYFRNKRTAIETTREIEKFGVQSLMIRGNVADAKHVDAIFEKITAEFGQLDILVSNAASGVLKPALDLTERHWQWTMNINAGALVRLTQKAVPLMEGRRGTVVAVSSLGAVRALPSYAAVGASKAALESLVRHLAVELAPRNINVNVVSAGVVDTDALKYFPHREEMLEQSRQRTPAGRLTTPEDVANVVTFLCTSLADMIHGQTIIVDGGYSVQA